MANYYLAQTVVPDWKVPQDLRSFLIYLSRPRFKQ